MQSVEVSSKLVDNQKIPIQDVTVYLSRAKDSSLITYAASDGTGLFKLSMTPLAEASVLTIDMEGYRAKSISFENLLQSRNIGNMGGGGGRRGGGEIVIVTDAPIRVK